MGVQARLVLCGSEAEKAAAAANAAFGRLDEVDAALSDWRVDSELNRLCARAGEGPIEVGPDLLDALERALAIAAATDGAFDPTAGPVVRVWREARRTGRLPDPAVLQRAQALVGWRFVQLDADARTVALEHSGMQLDLGGIGKGWAADAALGVLAQRGFQSALVDLGGDLAIGAAPPGTDGWRVGIDCAPEPETLVLTHAGVATSGDREQHLDVGGRRYSHVLDPRTGEALVDAPCVTVVAPDGTLADALASAASVLGAEAAGALEARFDPARVLVRPADR